MSDPQRRERILIGFNAGITIDLSQWIAAHTPDVLATNFGQPAELFERFPCRDVFMRATVDRENRQRISNHKEPVRAVAAELFDQTVFPIEIGLHLLRRHIGALVGTAVAV